MLYKPLHFGIEFSQVAPVKNDFPLVTHDFPDNLKSGLPDKRTWRLSIRKLVFVWLIVRTSRRSDHCEANRVDRMGAPGLGGRKCIARKCGKRFPNRFTENHRDIKK